MALPRLGDWLWGKMPLPRVVDGFGARSPCHGWNKKKPTGEPVGFLKMFICDPGRRLTLGELELFACTWLASFFALFHPWVTAKEACGFECWAKLGVFFDQRTGDAELDGTDLTVQTTTVGGNGDVPLFEGLGNLEW